MTRMCPLMAGPLFPPWICPLNVRGARARRPARRPPLPLSAEEGWGEGHQDAADGGTSRDTVLQSNAPFVDRLAVRQTLVAIARHGKPSVGEAPAEGGILLAIVHMAVDLLAVDLLHVVGEEVG